MVPETPRAPVGELKVMSFGEHLEELRSRIIRSLLVTVFFALIALAFQDSLMQALSGPHRRAMAQVQGRQLALEISKRLAELRETLVEIPLREGGSAVADEEARATAWAELDALATARTEEEPLASAVLALLSTDRRTAITGSGVSGRLARIEADLILATDDHAWGAAEDIEAARDHADAVGEVVALWRAEAADPGPGDPPPADRAAAILRDLDGELGQLGALSERLREWRRETIPLKLLHYTEAFFSHLKLAFLVGILIGLPWITLEMWQFISAGLYHHEKSSVAPFLPFSLIGLVLGGLFAYRILIPVGLTYLGGYGDPELFDQSFTLSNYMSLVFTLLIGMGLVFQLPLVMIFLSRSGILTPRQFREYQKFAILGALVLGAFLTPPDVVTQLLMAIPLMLLYESGIWASVWFRRRAEARKELES